MRRALVLSGGGARGAFQVGMLRVLVGEHGLDFPVLRGVSVGALNAAFLAQAPVGEDGASRLAEEVERLHRVWTEEIRGNASVYRRRPGGALGLVGGANSVHDHTPLGRLIRRHVSLDRLRASGRDFAVGAVSLVTGGHRTFAPDDDDFLRRVLASASIPVVFPFLDFPGDPDVLVDGGVRDISPLGSAFASGADEIWVLLTSRLERAPGGGVPEAATREDRYEDWQEGHLGLEIDGFDVLARAVDVLTDEVYLGDLRTAIRWNRVCAAVEGIERDLGDAGPAARSALARMQAALDAVDRRRVALFVLAPRAWYGARNAATEFDPAAIRAAIAHGEAVARDRALWFWPPVAGADGGDGS